MDATSVARGLSIGVLNQGGAASSSDKVMPVNSLNAPTLGVQGTANTGDNVPVTSTTSDSDGATTTGVQLIDNGALLGAMTDGGGGNWSYALNAITVGSHTLVARRQTAQGPVDSAPHTVVVTTPGGVGDGNMQVDQSTGVAQVDLSTGILRSNN
jgi:hypothetical protein